MSEVKVDCDVVLDPAPTNSLPDWKECRLRVENSEYIDQRISDGGFGYEEDGYYANEIHKFIHEYDDSDPHRSAWFLHRLEKLIEFVKEDATKT
jgi:hypothetical protein